MVLKDWAKEFDIKYTTLYQRIYRSGLTFEEAIQKDPFNKLITIGIESKPMKKWCEIYEIDFNLVNNRINKYNWKPIEALSIPKGHTRQEFNKKK
jgi:DNA modification methylase